MRKMEREKMMFFLAAIVMLFIGVVEGRNMSSKDIEVERLLKRLNKPAVKTIKSEDGDIIDCVDIYKQLAFDHPLLKNHTIQMWPNDYTEDRKMNASSAILSQLWRKSGACPDGTVPVRRIQKSDILKAPSLYGFGMKDVGDHVERAVVAIEKGKFYGASAKLNVWNMHVEPHDISLTSVSLFSTDLGAKEPSVLRAGWLVSDRVYKDRKTRLFTYWTWDGAHSTGCYDQHCPGFVLANKDFALGTIIAPVSKYYGDQYGVTFTITLDRTYNNWWVKADGTPIGYWPSSIVRNMIVASTVTCGGEVTTGVNVPHTSTQMGSGHYSREGFKRAAYVGDVLYKGEDGKDHKPDVGTRLIADSVYCYDIEFTGSIEPDPTTGYNFFYGGSGVGENCS